MTKQAKFGIMGVSAICVIGLIIAFNFSSFSNSSSQNNNQEEVLSREQSASKIEGLNNQSTRLDEEAILSGPERGWTVEGLNGKEIDNEVKEEKESTSGANGLDGLKL